MRNPLAILLFVAASALGQEPELECALDQTYGECVNRLVTAMSSSDQLVADRAAQAASEAAVEELTEKSVPEAAPDAAGAIRDFLPLFFSSLGLGSVEEGEGSLNFTFNPDFLDLGPSNPISLQAVMKDAVLLDALVKAIPEGIRQERKSALEEELGDFDDVEVSLSWSRESERYGRNPRDHQNLLSGVFLELTRAAQERAGTSESKRLVNALALDLSQELQNTKLADVAPERRAALLKASEAAFREISARTEALREQARLQRFYELGDLVNNQPQILASAIFRQRNELTGPDELAAKVSYEIGFANVNGLKKHCRQEDEDEVTGECLRNYLNRFGSTLENSPRLALTAEYSEADEFRFELPEDDLVFQLDRIRKTTGTLTYGRYLRPSATNVQATRFDLEAKYEDVTGDPLRRDRFVATATFTQKLTEDISATVSAIYANKPEYRGEVDEELGARLGLKYKIDRREPDGE